MGVSAGIQDSEDTSTADTEGTGDVF